MFPRPLVPVAVVLVLAGLVVLLFQQLRMMLSLMQHQAQ
jgi:hypothetical protein